MTDHSVLLLEEPNWCPLACRHAIPEAALSWLLESGSITQRLRHECPGRLRVEVLRQAWLRLFFSEHQLLKLNPQHRHLSREVLLYSETQAWVIARTVIPRQTLTSLRRGLDRLGNRPLGEIIFASASLKRHRSQLCQVPPGLWQPALQQRLDLQHPIWGRRTVYLLHDKPLLISEFFLPPLWTR
ncbi:MAG: chorismate lyase [Methylococcales bacterium]|nr:chorismate lyase [Methylococcales bacterium]